MKYLNSCDPLLIIVGPSGSGKSTAVQLLCAKKMIKITPSWTSRPARPEEHKTSIEHRFVSEKDFLSKRKDGFFLESVRMFSLPFWYGLPKIVKPQQGRIPVVILRASLLSLASRHFNNYKVYHIEDSKKRIANRLKKRTMRGEIVGSRLQDFTKEVSLGRKLADRIFINTKMDVLIKSITKALKEDFDI